MHGQHAGASVTHGVIPPHSRMAGERGACRGTARRCGETSKHELNDEALTKVLEERLAGSPELLSLSTKRESEKSKKMPYFRYGVPYSGEDGAVAIMTVGPYR